MTFHVEEHPRIWPWLSRPRDLACATSPPASPTLSPSTAELGAQLLACPPMPATPSCPGALARALSGVLPPPPSFPWLAPFLLSCQDPREAFLITHRNSSPTSPSPLFLYLVIDCLLPPGRQLQEARDLLCLFLGVSPDPAQRLAHD